MEGGPAAPLVPVEGHDQAEGDDGLCARDGGSAWSTAFAGRPWPGEAGSGLLQRARSAESQQLGSVVPFDVPIAVF